MSIRIAFMHDYMQLTDISDLGRYQFIMLCYVYEWQWHGHPTHCTLHMFKIKTLINEPLYYLNILVLNAK